MGLHQILTVRAWSAFTLHGSKNPRWNTQIVKENVVKGAVVAILNSGRTSRRGRGTNPATGETTVDVTGLRDGRYTLRLVPQAGEMSLVPAGPALIAGTAERMYRVLD